MLRGGPGDSVADGRRVFVQGAEDDTVSLRAGMRHRDPDPPAGCDELEAASLLEQRDLHSLGMRDLAEEGPVDVVGQLGVDVPRRFDERLLQQLGSRDALELREPVSYGDGRHELERAELLVSKRRIDGSERREDDRDVESERADPFDELGGQSRVELDLHIRESILEGLQESLRLLRHPDDRGSHLQEPASPTLRESHARDGSIREFDRQSGLVQERPTRLCELHAPPPVAREKLGVEGQLHLPDLLGKT